jgi:hypothetical protein
MGSPSSGRKFFLVVENGIWTLHGGSTIYKLNALGRIMLVDGGFGVKWAHLPHRDVGKYQRT